jgi:hypothetical protein
MYLIPDSKACAEDFGEGPDAVHGECKECEKFYLDNGRRCCKEGTAKLKDGEYIVDQYIEDDVVCCGAFNPKGMSA